MEKKVLGQNKKIAQVKILRAGELPQSKETEGKKGTLNRKLSKIIKIKSEFWELTKNEETKKE